MKKKVFLFWITVLTASLMRVAGVNLTSTVKVK